MKSGPTSPSVRCGNERRLSTLRAAFREKKQRVVLGFRIARVTTDRPLVACRGELAVCWSPYEEHSHDSPLATRVANEFIGTTAGLARAARTTSDLAGGPRRASRALYDCLHGHFGDSGSPVNRPSGTLPYVIGLAKSNSNSNASEIEFDPTVFSAATPATITLTRRSKSPKRLGRK